MIVAKFPSNTQLAVRKVPGKGRGVFALVDIPAGTPLFCDPVVVIPEEHGDMVDDSVMGRYAFEWNDEDQCMVFGIGSLINHGLPANVEFDSNLETMTMDFRAAIDIKRGEELCYDYGHPVEDLRDYYGIPG